MNDKLEAAKRYLGPRHVFSRERRDEMTKARRDQLPVLLLALMARKK